MTFNLPAHYSKILKDIWSHKARSLLVILSIAVGIAAVGMINNAGRLIQRDLYSKYAAGNPAVLYIYVSPFQKDLAQAVEGLREVETVEPRRIHYASLLHGDGDREDLELNTVPDFEELSVSQFTVEDGKSSPGIREILLERQTAWPLGLKIGDSVTVEMDNERRYTLKVAGIVHDIYVMPFNLMRQATGYVSMDTLRWMGESPYYNRLDIVVSENKFEKKHVLQVGDLARDRVIEPAGYQVSRLQIPGVGSDPGDHWGHNQIKGFLLILQIMGILAMLLSCGLVINTVSAILVQQIKQIGILRSVGAVRWQVVRMYLFNVLVFSILGLVIAIPLGLAGAWWLTNFAASFLNFNIGRINLPASILFQQLLLGLIMPAGVALIPILAGTRLSVYDAIYQYGLGGDEDDRLERLLGKLRRLNPPVLLSLRNTFRKKARLIFTLVTLTLAGAMFIAAFSTYTSLTKQINQIEKYIYFDAALRVPAGSNRFSIEREAERVPAVSLAEGWAQDTGVFVFPDGSESEEVEIIGLPYDIKTIHPILLAGEWLQGENLPQVVINEDLVDVEKRVKVGDQIVIKVGDRKQEYQVIGLVSKHLSGARVYIDFSTFGKLTGRPNQIDQVRVLSNPAKISPPEKQHAIASALENYFKNAGLSDSTSTIQNDYFGNFTDIFGIILFVLVIMAGILAVVGGLGLTGSLGMNVLERTREIGVLRAVGAANSAVLQVVIVEGMLVGLLSWLFGALISAPTSVVLANAVIQAVFESQASYQYSYLGLLVWFVIVMLIAVLASLVPARNATRLRVREVLDYE